MLPRHVELLSFFSLVNGGRKEGLTYLKISRIKRNGLQQMLGIDNHSKSSLEVVPTVTEQAVALTNLGEYRTKSGQRLEMSVFENDPKDKTGTKDGWVVHRFRASINGEEVGYLKVTYIPKDEFSRRCPDLCHFANVYGGFGFKDINNRESVWNSLNNNFGCWGMPAPECIETLEKDIARFSENFRSEYDRYLKRIVSDAILPVTKETERGKSQYELDFRALK